MSYKIYNKNYIKKMVIRLNEIWEGDWNLGGRVAADAIGCVAGALEREWRVPLLVPCGRRFEMEWLVPLLVPLLVGVSINPWPDRKPAKPNWNYTHGSDRVSRRVVILKKLVWDGLQWAGAGVKILTHRHPARPNSVTYSYFIVYCPITHREKLTYEYKD
jgi:hypothetical protein